MLFHALKADFFFILTGRPPFAFKVTSLNNIYEIKTIFLTLYLFWKVLLFYSFYTWSPPPETKNKIYIPAVRWSPVHGAARSCTPHWSISERLQLENQLSLDLTLYSVHCTKSYCLQIYMGGSRNRLLSSLVIRFTSIAVFLVFGPCVAMVCFMVSGSSPIDQLPLLVDGFGPIRNTIKSTVAATKTLKINRIP